MESLDKPLELLNKFLDIHVWTPLTGNIERTNHAEKVKNPEGYKEASESIARGQFFEDIPTLYLANNQGKTIAHLQAEKGWIPSTDDKNLLSLADDAGNTVAHALAQKHNINNAWDTQNLDILKLKDEKGMMVADYLCSFGWLPDSPQVLKELFESAVADKVTLLKSQSQTDTKVKSEAQGQKL